jgi:hypothetical protein
MALTQTIQKADNVQRYYREVRSGTYTAADFTVSPGFAPLTVQVANVTDNLWAIWRSDFPTPNALQTLITGSTGAYTYADCGISVTGRTISVDISVAGLATNDDLVLGEAWG